MIHVFRSLVLGLVLGLMSCAGQVKQAQSTTSIPAAIPTNKAPSLLAGTYSAVPADGSRGGARVTLHLKADGTVRCVHDFFNNDPIEETGVWKENGDSIATVTLTGLDSGRLYKKPDVIIFRLVNDYLVAIKYDYFVYGYRGLRLKRATWRRLYKSG